MDDLALVATVPVAKSKATFKQGPKKGKLRPGCRFKGKKAYCTPEVATRLKGMKVGKKGGGRKGGPPVGKTPQARANQEAFRTYQKLLGRFKSEPSCGEKRSLARAIRERLDWLSKLPKRPGAKLDVATRNARYRKSFERIMQETTLACSMGGVSTARTVAVSGMKRRR